MAAADLEDVLGAVESERLHHPGDQRGLRRHLAVGNRQRLVNICAGHHRARDEPRTRHGAEGIEDALVVDARGLDCLDQVGRPRGLISISHTEELRRHTPAVRRCKRTARDPLK